MRQPSRSLPNRGRRTDTDVPGGFAAPRRPRSSLAQSPAVVRAHSHSTLGPEEPGALLRSTPEVGVPQLRELAGSAQPAVLCPHAVWKVAEVPRGMPTNGSTSRREIFLAAQPAPSPHWLQPPLLHQPASTPGCQAAGLPFVRESVTTWLED